LNLYGIGRGRPLTHPRATNRVFKRGIDPLDGAGGGAILDGVLAVTVAQLNRKTRHLRGAGCWP